MRLFWQAFDAAGPITAARLRSLRAPLIFSWDTSASPWGGVHAVDAQCLCIAYAEGI